jgi:hypothetical protein
MAYRGYCAHCGSYDMIAGQDMYQCLHCGRHTHTDGTAMPSLTEPTQDETKETE